MPAILTLQIILPPFCTLIAHGLQQLVMPFSSDLFGRPASAVAILKGLLQ